MKKKLPREKQCAKCPWKVSTDPNEIPNGYCETKHRKLKRTIANPGEIRLGGTRHVMACHESDGTDDMFCIGWLINQLGPGNNIMLRLKMLDYDFKNVETFGDQHETFEDTLP